MKRNKPLSLICILIVVGLTFTQFLPYAAGIGNSKFPTGNVRVNNTKALLDEEIHSTSGVLSCLRKKQGLEAAEWFEYQLKHF